MLLLTSRPGFCGVCMSWVFSCWNSMMALCLSWLGLSQHHIQCELCKLPVPGKGVELEGICNPFWSKLSVILWKSSVLKDGNVKGYLVICDDARVKILAKVEINTTQKCANKHYKTWQKRHCRWGFCDSPCGLATCKWEDVWRKNAFKSCWNPAFGNSLAIWSCHRSRYMRTLFLIKRELPPGAQLFLQPSSVTCCPIKVAWTPDPTRHTAPMWLMCNELRW